MHPLRLLIIERYSSKLARRPMYQGQKARGLGIFNLASCSLACIMNYITFSSSAQSPLSGVGGDVHLGPSAFEMGSHFPVRGLNQEA